MAVKNSRQFPGFKDSAFTLYNSQKQCKVLNLACERGTLFSMEGIRKSTFSAKNGTKVG